LIASKLKKKNQNANTIKHVWYINQFFFVLFPYSKEPYIKHNPARTRHLQMRKNWQKHKN